MPASFFEYAENSSLQRTWTNKPTMEQFRVVPRSEFEVVNFQQQTLRIFEDQIWSLSQNEKFH